MPWQSVEQSKQRVGDTPSPLPPAVKKHLVAKHASSAYATRRDPEDPTHNYLLSFIYIKLIYDKELKALDISANNNGSRA